MDIGAEWLVEAAGCDGDALRSVDVLRGLFASVVSDLDLHPLHEAAFHVFPPPGGVTGFVMLTESHLACHTYPEHGIVTINLYCCRPRPEWPWRERLTALFRASEVRVRALERAMPVTAGASS